MAKLLVTATYGIADTEAALAALGTNLKVLIDPRSG